MLHEETFCFVEDFVHPVQNGEATVDRAPGVTKLIAEIEESNSVVTASPSLRPAAARKRLRRGCFRHGSILRLRSGRPSGG